MKLKTISLVLFSLILGVGCSQRNDNQPQANSDGASKRTKANQQSKPSTSPSGPSRDAVFKNLQVYFINGENRGQNAKYLPLAEAMEKGIARVNETGEVSSLTIENLSETEHVFVNAGDIVKGGKQDRYLVNSLIIPPNSGKIDLASFCVEAGRWSQRGRESVTHFSDSKFAASSSELKLAAQLLNDQGEVWKEVAKAKYQLGESLALSASVDLPASLALTRVPPVTVAAATPSPLTGIPGLPTIPGSLNQAAVDPNTGLPLPVQEVEEAAKTAASQATELPARAVADEAVEQSLAQLELALVGPEQAQMMELSALGSTSLPLALENPKIQELVKKYTGHMDRHMANQKNPVGFAVAINGKIVSADIYGESSLFKALWPKLISGAATEAVAKYDEKAEAKNLKPADFEAFLTNKEQESPVKKDLNDQTKLLTIKGDRHILFETHDKRVSKNWIHRNYLAAPEK